MNLIKALSEVTTRAGYRARAYSGRGMMGNYCFAFATSDPGMEVGYKLASALSDCPDDLQSFFSENSFYWEHELGKVRTDALGCDVVYYFPTIPWEDPGE